jgi:hypothetical protein
MLCIGSDLEMFFGIAYNKGVVFRFYFCHSLHSWNYKQNISGEIASTLLVHVRQRQRIT